MTLLDNVFELIDLRSFSNLWFWIALAVTWSTTSHWVLGVPWDMAMRARRGLGETAMADFEDMMRINTARLMFIAAQSGTLLAGITAFMLTSLALLGFVYGNEFSQALFLLGFPLTGVGLLSLRTARLIHAEAPRGAALIKRLSRHRVLVQMIGMASIFVTAMWGMYQNMAIGPLG